MPGTDYDEALRLVLGELPDLPYLPELPARGPGADLLGRSAVLLPDLPVEIQPSGWRLTGRPGRELRRAQDLLRRDLDALEEQAGEYRGAFKLQVAGPWTLAVGIELPSGHRVVSDPGAVRDLAESLAEGVRLHLAEVARRVPGAQLVLQVDEPSLPSVLAGTVPTASGYGTVRSVEISVVRRVLADVLAVAPAGGRVVHCCAADAPVALLREAGADAVALDLALKPDRDPLGDAVDAGTSLWLGTLPSTDARIGLKETRAELTTFWRTLGFPASSLAASVIPTPSCGLAGASPAYVRRALEVLREAGHSLRDDA